MLLWFQVSRSGWNDFLGSAFVVELQVGETYQVGGRGPYRARVPRFMSSEELAEATRVQNDVVRSLTRPPDDYYMFDDPNLKSFFLRKLEPVPPYSVGDDIWFRYGQRSHVLLWAEYLRPILLRSLTELGEATFAKDFSNLG